jgi:hypothetical protein
MLPLLLSDNPADSRANFENRGAIVLEPKVFENPADLPNSRANFDNYRRNNDWACATI